MGIRMILIGFLLTQSLQAQNIIPQAPVEPSPWWIIDRFGQNLVTKTTIDRENQRLILTIDSGVWSNLDYLGRYSILHHLGSSTTPYGYSLVLQTPRKTIVASLTKTTNTWQIEPPTLGTLPLRGNPSPLR